MIKLDKQCKWSSTVASRNWLKCLTWGHGAYMQLMQA